MKTRPSPGSSVLARWFVRVAPVVAAAAVVVSFVLDTGLVSSASAHTGMRAAVTGSETFTDPVGDEQPEAPDITTVVISDIAETGMITVAVTATGFDATKAIFVQLNTDKDGATGTKPSGWDYELVAGQNILARNPEGSFWHVGNWDGSAWKVMEQSPTMSFAQSGDAFTWQLNKDDLGGTSGFELSVLTVALDSSRVPNLLRSDLAPDWPARWLYDLPIPPTPTPAVVVKPLIGKPVANPAKAVAGKRMTVSFPITRSDSGAPLTSGTMICDPSVKGKVLKHAESFRAGTARLTFVVPKTARGKLLKVKVKIVNGARSATKIATFHIS